MSAWVNEASIAAFKQLAEPHGITLSDVIVNAIQTYLVQEREASKMRSDKLLAKRIFRIIVSVLGPKDVLEEVLRIVPGHQVDKAIAVHRGEKKA